MRVAAKQHPVDTLADLMAPALLASAAGWSAWQIAGSMLPSVAAVIGALAIGFAAMHFLGTTADCHEEPRFEPTQFESCMEEPDVLLLDDRLVEVESDARVVQLFARETATPGEIVARIADYLGGDRQLSVPATEEGSASPPDASAALHEALANIRASLR